MRFLSSAILGSIKSFVCIKKENLKNYCGRGGGGWALTLPQVAAATAEGNID